MGVSVAEGTVVEWKKQPGDWVEARRDHRLDLDRQDRHRRRVAGHRARAGDPRRGRRDGRRRHRDGADRHRREARRGARLGASASGGHVARPRSRSRRRARRASCPGDTTETHAGTAQRGTPEARRSGAAALLAGGACGSPPSTASTSSRSTGTGRGGRVRKQDVLAYLGAATARRAEPPMHIEIPYKPEPGRAAQEAGRAQPAPRRPAASRCRACASRSAEHMMRLARRPRRRARRSSRPT